MKMKLPNEVKIMGLTYKVQEVNVVDKNEPLWGQIDYQNQVIKIDAEMSDERKCQTFMHELLHGVLTELGYRQLNEDENAVQSISAALYHALSGQLTSS